MGQELETLRRMASEEKFRRMAEHYLATRAAVEWDPEKDYEPAVYRRQRILREMLGRKG